MLSRVRAFASAFPGSLGHLRLQLRAELLHRALDIHVRVPDLEVVHPRKALHRRAISLDGAEHDLLLVLDREAVVDRGDQHAHRKALDIPLPRTWEGLVEVV
jgi:hypothetical protein